MGRMLRPKTREYQLYPLKPPTDPGPDVRIDVESEV